MTTNSSISDFLPHPNLSSVSSDLPLDFYCLTTRPGSFIITSYIITCILLLLPLCIFIIYHGLHQWRQTSSSAATMSHSDSFTYNMVAMEMISVSGCVLSCCGIYSHCFQIFIVGFSLYSFTWFGEMAFHVLTCVERYLAVVHPITYLNLRKERGIRIRNISITCVWLLSAAETSLLILTESVFYDFCILMSSLAVVSFCSISVLCVLIGPGPGEQGGARKRVDQSKQRAFYTILVILGVLVVRFTWNLVWSVLTVVYRDADCVLVTAGVWFNLPSSLVLPLLFLLRAGKLMCWKKNIQ